MGGADDAHIHRLFLRAAYHAHLFFLNGAQQFDLHRQRQVGHFVKEQRAAAGGLKHAFLVLLGTGKSPFFVAEKFAFHQVFRNGATIHCDKRIVTP